MQLIFEVLKLSFLRNIAALGTVSIFGNVVFGLIVGVVSCACLQKDASRPDSYFSIEMKEMSRIIRGMILLMVFVAPPFPSMQADVVKLLSMAICISTLLITSVTDEKKSCFTLGFLMAGTFGEGVLLSVSLASKRLLMSRADLVTVLVCVLIILVASIGSAKGDMGLLLMVMLSYMVCMGSAMWVGAVLITLVVAWVTFVVRYASAFIRQKKLGIKLPFSLHIFIGVLTTFMLVN